MRLGLPWASERRGATNSAALSAMNSRRFISHLLAAESRCRRGYQTVCPSPQTRRLALDVASRVTRKGRAWPHTWRRVVGHHSEVFIGIDTSKLQNAVAIAEGG